MPKITKLPTLFDYYARDDGDRVFQQSLERGYRGMLDEGNNTPRPSGTPLERGIFHHGFALQILVLILRALDYIETGSPQFYCGNLTKIITEVGRNPLAGFDNNMIPSFPQ
ncbi:MAG: hypothetical protein AB1744_10670 [Candidatus Zixiibacteriota bacterium]